MRESSLQGNSREDPLPRKRSYGSPRLVVHGTVRHLTQGANGSQLDNRNLPSMDVGGGNN